MKKKKYHRNHTLADVLLESKPAVLVVAVLSICMGLFFMFFPTENTPITQNDAVTYIGDFKEYESSRNYRSIVFTDGTQHSVYPHTESNDFRQRMESLEVGTRLYIAVNPNNNYVIEVKTETEELMNFETSQEEIYSYSKGYIAIGLLACVCGVLLIGYVILKSVNERKEDERIKKRDVRQALSQGSPIRNASPEQGKILLKKSYSGYNICYRRINSVNELVVNGMVYDEKKAIIEFEHVLCAEIDDHKIEAGLDELSFSYIAVDGKRIAEKKRLI